MNSSISTGPLVVYQGHTTSTQESTLSSKKLDPSNIWNLRVDAEGNPDENGEYTFLSNDHLLEIGLSRGGASFIDSVNKDGKTPLYIAFESVNSPMIQRLLNHNASIEASGILESEKFPLATFLYNSLNDMSPETIFVIKTIVEYASTHSSHRFIIDYLADISEAFESKLENKPIYNLIFP